MLKKPKSHLSVYHVQHILDEFYYYGILFLQNNYLYIHVEHVKTPLSRLCCCNFTYNSLTISTFRSLCDLISTQYENTGNVTLVLIPILDNASLQQIFRLNVLHYLLQTHISFWKQFLNVNNLEQDFGFIIFIFKRCNFDPY